MMVPLVLLLPVVFGKTTDYSDFFGTPDNPFNIRNETRDKNFIACSTDSDKVCVPYYLCNTTTDSTYQSAGNIIDIKASDCPHYLSVCCPKSEVRTAAETVAVRSDDAGCGYSNPTAKRLRVINTGEDNVADYGEFPWMVALIKNTDHNTVWSQDDYIGGGSIIHPSVVMTVVHKVHMLKPDELRCRAGEYDTQTEQEEFPYQERNVTKIVLHEDYYSLSVYNNIALLFLSQPFNLTNAPHIGIGCLPKVAPPAHSECHSMGWGAEFRDSEKYSVILKKVDLPTMARDRCQRNMRTKTRLGNHFELHFSLTCAGGEQGKDTCKGDGGAPLVCPIQNPNKTAPGTDSGRFAIYGMVAYGIGCGTPGVPGIYVNVPIFYDWITKQMAQAGYDASTYTFD